VARTTAVFFDVDFTLIFPGPRFQGSGYQTSCARYGIAIDPTAFDVAVSGAAALLDSADQLYDPELFVSYTRRIIELMGGSGVHVDRVAREIYEDWALNHHFSLYADVQDTLVALHGHGVRLGLISNGHRCLASFQSHFELDGLISATVSSSDHGFLKPHPTIFRAAMDLMQVAPEDAAMVGDSLAHDVLGARDAGMRAVLLARGGAPPGLPGGVEVISSLAELPGLILHEVHEANEAHEKKRSHEDR
jgi:putative hydrolase of the HAD superfamily